MHVPYKGGPPAVTDLIGGQVKIMFETSVVRAAVRQAGQAARAGGEQPAAHRRAPDVPTIAELGYPGFSGVPWVAVMAPTQTPPAIVAKLNGEINKVLQAKETRDYFAAQGVEPMVMSTDELGAYVKSEIAKWTKAVRDSGAKAD